MCVCEGILQSRNNIWKVIMQIDIRADKCMKRYVGTFQTS